MSAPNREVDGMMVVDALLRERGMVAADEVWVHGMWTPDKWWKCVKAKLSGKKLVRMTHGSLSPIYLRRQGKWKKRLAKPVERLLFSLADRVVVTGPWEEAWCRAWGMKGPFETVDLKEFFSQASLEATSRLRSASPCQGTSPLQGALHVLYLGRRHPLKGLRFLEEAVKGLDVELRVVSDKFGDALEEEWRWADVLCLPTLSENFGLVVAEALERGKPVITTDGAPAWEGQPGVVYLKGYRDGSDEDRVRLLKDAIGSWL